MEETFFSELSAAGEIRVRIVPGAPRSYVAEKMGNGVWKVKITAPAVHGKANTELLKFLHQKGKIDAKIIRGHKNREKIIRVSRFPH